MTISSSRGELCLYQVHLLIELLCMVRHSKIKVLHKISKNYPPHVLPPLPKEIIWFDKMKWGISCWKKGGYWLSHLQKAKSSPPRTMVLNYYTCNYPDNFRKSILDHQQHTPRVQNNKPCQIITFFLPKHAPNGPKKHDKGEMDGISQKKIVESPLEIYYVAG